MLNGLVTALRTLTILPVPGKDAERFSTALYWFPVAGFLIGSFQAAAASLVMFSGWSEAASAMVLLAGFVLTGGIHADGLADTADGFFCSGSKEKRLRIMKDPAVGSFGAIFRGMIILLKWIALTRLLESGLFQWIVAGAVLSRFVQVVLASSLPYARSGGGTASGFVEGAGWRHIGITLLLAGMLHFILLRDMVPAALVVLLVVLPAAGILAFFSRQRTGGVTGDVLGASSEMTEMLVWLTAGFYLQ